MATRFTMRGGKLVNKATGEVAEFDPRAPVVKPYVVSDIPPYRSPIDGREISSRSMRRDDLARNGCVEWEPGMGKAAVVSEKNRHKLEKRA
jgi:hypothetical protein